MTAPPFGAAPWQQGAALERRSKLMRQFVLSDSPVLMRFYAKIRVDPETGCWEWTGSQCGPVRATGRYGQMCVGGRNVRAHRLAYELFVGPIPDGLTIDHLCRNTLCANPIHLEPVPMEENLRRGQHHGGGGWWRYQTHCKRGHLFDDKNTYSDPAGARRCRICQANYQRQYRRERRRAFCDGAQGQSCAVESGR